MSLSPFWSYLVQMKVYLCFSIRSTLCFVQFSRSPKVEMDFYSLNARADLLGMWQYVTQQKRAMPSNIYLVFWSNLIGFHIKNHLLVHLCNRIHSANATKCRLSHPQIRRSNYVISVLAYACGCECLLTAFYASIKLKPTMLANIVLKDIQGF